MIDVKELMVDNLVEYNGQVLPVAGIAPPLPRKEELYDGKWLIELVDNGFITAIPKQVNPIILTENELKLFHFEREDREDYSIWSNDTFSLHQERWGDHVGTDFCYATRLKDGEFKSGIVVKHVHQLQNLYLCVQRKKLENLF